MSRVTASVREQRLALGHASVGRLIEWQGRAVGRGLSKPTYSELLDALVEHAVASGLDVVRLLQPADTQEGVA